MIKAITNIRLIYQSYDDFTKHKMLLQNIKLCLMIWNFVFKFILIKNITVLNSSNYYEVKLFGRENVKIM